jgi:hypothetical protein
VWARVGDWKVRFQEGYVWGRLDFRKGRRGERKVRGKIGRGLVKGRVVQRRLGE